MEFIRSLIRGSPVSSRAMSDLGSNDPSMIGSQSAALSRANLGLERARRKALERDKSKDV